MYYGGRVRCVCENQKWATRVFGVGVAYVFRVNMSMCVIDIGL